MPTPISRREFIRPTSTAASLTALASVYAPSAPLEHLSATRAERQAVAASHALVISCQEASEAVDRGAGWGIIVLRSIPH